MEKHLIAQRIADYLTSRNLVFEEKKMFGGICFMLNDKMLAGANRHGKLLVRVDPDGAEQWLRGPGEVQPMMQGERPMPGYFYVMPDGFERDADLVFWLEKCLEYHPKTRSAKKK